MLRLYAGPERFVEQTLQLSGPLVNDAPRAILSEPAECESPSGKAASDDAQVAEELPSRALRARKSPLRAHRGFDRGA